MTAINRQGMHSIGYVYTLQHVLRTLVSVHLINPGQELAVEVAKTDRSKPIIEVC